MGRAPCCEKVGIKRGRWTAEEDQILANYIQSKGEGSWRSLPKNAGLKRCGKSCRLRWINYLRSDLKRGNITPEEEELVVKLHSTLGNRWSLIASHLPGRTDNEIKNYWNSHLSRKLHNFMRKPSSLSQNLIMNGAPAPEPPQTKRRLGRTSRSAMKPKIHSTKPRKTKKTSAMESTKEVAEEEEGGALMIALSGAEGACDYYGDYCNENVMSINDDNGVLSFDDDIIELLLDESEPSHVNNNTSCGGEMELNSTTTRVVSEGTESNQGNLECLQSCPSVESFLNYENQVNEYALTDWNCVWQENSYNNLWDEKEGPGSMVSWLLEGDEEATIGKSNCENFGEPLDHDEENALVSWLLS